MLVSVEVEKCTACGVCVLECPDVFDQDDEGIVVLLDSSPPEDRAAAVEDAAEGCPSAVIKVSA
ncbi:ferredoxin [Streptomyces sp. GD-15H]|uniref:ferredoxin n=1 Tax=Streptomyces sp. GD-15H TaxID=3129112 RepID=UPI0032536A86